MDASPTSSQPAKRPLSWLSLLQLVLSALASTFLFGAAAIILTTALTSRYAPGSSSADLTRSSMIAASLAFTGALILPSAWYAWKRIAYPEAQPTSRPESPRYGLILTILVIAVIVAALFLGNWAAKNPQVSWYLLPPLNIIATGLPALWLVYIGTRGLLQASPSRKWGVFATGLAFGPLLILILEFIALFGIGLLAILWFALNPDFSGQLNSLALRLQTIGPDLEMLLPTLLPFLLNPFFLFLVFAFVSVIIPMIEEALKPIGVWFLADQKITPAQGFAFGVLSGVGFGLFENLGNSSAGGDTWALLVSTRISTLLLHSLSAGLVGWALASAWSQKRYLRLGITYLVAVLLHGLWNGMAVLSFFSSMQSETDISVPAALVQLGNLSTIGIVALGAFNLVFFISFNTTLRRSLSQNPPPHQSLTPPLQFPPDENPSLPARAIPHSTEDDPTHSESNA